MIDRDGDEWTLSNFLWLFTVIFVIGSAIILVIGLGIIMFGSIYMNYLDWQVDYALKLASVNTTVKGYWLL